MGEQEPLPLAAGAGPWAAGARSEAALISGATRTVEAGRPAGAMETAREWKAKM